MLLSEMSGEQEISLTIKGDAEAVSNSVKDIEDVTNVNICEASEEGTSLLIVTAKKKSDVRELVFEKVISCKAVILEMKTVSKSLEDVFLELTDEGEQK